MVVTSVAQLQQYAPAGVVVTDLHMHNIDSITIPDPRGGDHLPMRRVEEVFDW